MRREGGFTLIELMVVIVIIGILATLGAANYVRLRAAANRGVCLEQQWGLRTVGHLYANDQGFDAGVINVNQLIATGYLGDGMAECPSSGVLDNDDYDLQFVDGAVISIACTHKGQDHAR